MNIEQPDQPELVFHVVVTDLKGQDAYGYIDDDGAKVVVADRAFLRNDPIARESAYRALIATG